MRCVRQITSILFFGFAGATLDARAGDATPKPSSIAPPRQSLGARILEAIGPTSMQRRPHIWFNVFTEMSEEGRKRREPTPANPIYYSMHVAKLTQTGAAVSAGERAPPLAEMEAAMRKALAAQGYLAVTQAEQRPELLVILNFGSHGTDPEFAVGYDGPRLVTAAELVPLVLTDMALFKDVIARATLIAGSKFAGELKAALDEEVRNMNSNRASGQKFAPVSPDFGSPFQSFALAGKNRASMEHLAEIAFHTCYFVVASAYDFGSVEKNDKRLLWRTKMTVEAGGVALDEIMNPLIANGGPYLGRETPEAVVVKKQIFRDGKVEIGNATVVGDGSPKSAPDSTPAPKP